MTQVVANSSCADRCERCGGPHRSPESCMGRGRHFESMSQARKPCRVLQQCMRLSLPVYLQHVQDTSICVQARASPTYPQQTMHTVSKPVCACIVALHACAQRTLATPLQDW